MSRSPLIRVISAKLTAVDCHTRIPFSFGIHTLTAAPYATVTVEIESSDKRRALGAASELLVPKWFKKDPALTPQQDSQQLVDSALAAFEVAKELDFMSCFDLWRSLYQRQVASLPHESDELLVRGFGVSIVERAVIDAVCRLTNQSFHQALLSGSLDFAPGRIHPQLENWSVENNLLAQPSPTVHVRHTVGLLDVLATKDLQDSDDPDDGLPTSLEQDIKEYGFSWFKLKVAGPGPEYVQRLIDIATVVEDCGVTDAHFTIDGNEQFESLTDLAKLLSEVSQHEVGARLINRLAFIEQPLSRNNTFDPMANAAMSEVNKFAPVIIDEADFGTWSFPAAINLGYQGVSVKACKGVFRALINYALCCDNEDLFQSGEDLTNLAVRGLQQDLSLMATLGIKHVERNGHHYFHGLDHLPASEVALLLEHHADLYEGSENFARLTITAGQLNIQSLNHVGFGCRLAP